MTPRFDRWCRKHGMDPDILLFGSIAIAIGTVLVAATYLAVRLLALCVHALA